MRYDSGQHRRMRLAGIVFGLLLISVCGRLYSLMVQNFGFYSQAALDNQTRITNVSGQRGLIYDRNMDILACNQVVQTLYLNPYELKQSRADLELVSTTLADILDLDKDWILEQSKDIKMRYKRIQANVDRETAQKIRDFMTQTGINGIHLEPASQRYYPKGSLASQVLGFTNASNTGSEGIEAAYNSFLEAGNSQVITTKGNNEMDMPYSYEQFQASQPGGSVVLTIDSTVQTCLEKQMKNAIARYDVQNGAFGMVMNVNTGEILAMATLGGYDPNQYLEIYDEDTARQLEEQKLAYLALPSGSEAYELGKKAYTEALQTARLKQWRNRCLSDGYEPGSTFKVLTMSAALDSGAIDLDTNFHCSGSEHIPGRAQLLHCWRSTGHGSQKTPQALQNSCNLAFAHIALKLGGERFYEYVKNFGILEKTGIDLAGESKGIFFSRELVTDTDKWGTASLTSGSFGQTFKLTPLQLVRAISAVVNGGNLMEPYLVSEVLDGEGNTILKQEPTFIRQVISPETSEVMCSLLESVVTEGTAKNASVSGFSIGGKTGTSEKIDVFDNNGNKTLDKIVSFVGVAPMDDPEYIVLVALDTPSRQTGIYISGGVMAAPTVGAVMADILPYLGVSTTEPSQSAVLEDLTGLSRKEADKLLQQQGFVPQFRGTGESVTDQLPTAGQELSLGNQVILYCGEDSKDSLVSVPDFVGMTRQQANDAAGKLGLGILARGNPDIAPNVTVTSQEIPKEKQVSVGTVIRLHFADTKAAD